MIQSANIAFMANRMGTSVEELAPSYDLYRAEFATGYLDMDGEGMDDRALYSAIGEKLGKEKQGREDHANLVMFAGKAALSARMAALEEVTHPTKDRAPHVQKHIDEKEGVSGDVFSSFFESLPEDMPEADKGKLVREYMGVYLDSHQQMKELATPIQELAASIRSIVEPFQGHKKGEDKLARAILPEDARAELFDAVLKYQDHPEFEDIIRMSIVQGVEGMSEDSFGENLTKLFGRSFRGVWDDLETDKDGARVSALRSGKVPVGFNLDSDWDAATLGGQVAGVILKPALTREATPEEQKRMLEAASEIEAQVKAKWKTREIVGEMADPVKRDDWFKNIAYNIADLSGFTGAALGAVALTRGRALPGLLASTMATKPIITGFRTEEYVRDYGMSLETAHKAATIQSFVEAPSEGAMALIPFGRMPILNTWVNKLAGKGITRWASNAAINVVGETGQEIAQDASAIMVAEWMSIGQKEFPQVESWDRLKELAGRSIETAIIVGPLAIFGSVGASLSQQERVKFSREHLGPDNEFLLRQYGLSEAEVASINALETPLEKEALFRSFTPDPALGEKYADEELKQYAERVMKSGEPPVLSRATRDGVEGFQIDFPKQKIPLFVENEIDAHAAIYLWHQDKANRIIEGLKGMPREGVKQAPEAIGEILQVERSEQAERGIVEAPAVIKAFETIPKAIGSLATAAKKKMLTEGRGEYHVREGMARLREANDLPGAAHELAHDLEAEIFGRKPTDQWIIDEELSTEAQDELIALGQNLYTPETLEGKEAPEGGFESEGFAEFTRMYLLNPQRAIQAAPEFSEFFEDRVVGASPKMTKAFGAAHKAYKQWDLQGGSARARAAHVDTGTYAYKFKEAMTNLSVAKLKQESVDVLSPIDEYVKTAKRKGALIDDISDPFLSAASLAMRAPAIVEGWMKVGMTDADGNIVGASLRERLRGIRGKGAAKDFNTYLHARRALAIYKHDREAAANWDIAPENQRAGVRPETRNPGMSEVDAQTFVKELEASKQGKAFTEAAESMYEWQESALDYIASYSPELDGLVKRIRESDAGDYAPLYRVGKGGKAEFRRLEGSGRQVKSLVNSYVSQAQNLVEIAHGTMVFDQMKNIAEHTEGMGGLLFRATETTELEGGAMDEVVLKDYRYSRQARKRSSKGTQEMRVFENGEMVTYEVDAGLYDALNGLSPIEMGWFQSALNFQARMFRLGTTGLRASFAMGTNPARDVVSLIQNSAANANTAQMLGEWGRQMYLSALSSFTGGKFGYDEWGQHWKSLGGAMAIQLKQDSMVSGRVSKELFHNRFVVTLNPANWIHGLSAIMQFSESAARVVEFKMVGKDLLKEAGLETRPENLTAGMSMRAVLASKQVTTDFTAGGRAAKSYNQISPFFNAGIQGPRANLRAARRDPKKFIVRGLMRTIPALAAWWNVKDEEWWKDMTDEMRYRFTWFNGPGNSVLRIPRDFTADGLFMASATAIADSLYRKDPEYFTGWMKEFLDELDPTGLSGMFDEDKNWFEGGIKGAIGRGPQTLKTFAEQFQNENFFYGSPIVKRQSEGQFLWEQHTDRTSGAAIWLGKTLKWSPERIDHVISSVFGRVGTELAEFVTGTGKVDIEKSMADYPVFGVFIAKQSGVQNFTRDTQKMWRYHDYATKNYNSSETKETAREKQMRGQLKDATHAVVLLGRAKTLTVSAAERKEIQQEKNRIANEIVKDFEGGEINMGKYMAWEARAKGLLTTKEK